MWSARLFPFTTEWNRLKYYRQIWSHLLMMEKSTQQWVPMSSNPSLEQSQPEYSPDQEGLHCALRRRKDKFLL